MKAVAEDGSSLELYSDTDNWESLQQFTDQHTDITIPDGRWPISRCLQIGNTAKRIRGYGVDRTGLIITGDLGGPVIGIGGDGRWTGSEGYGPVDGVRIHQIELIQTDDSNKNCHCIFFNDLSNDFIGGNIRVVGSSYEGIVIGGQCGTVHLHDIEACDCGNGGPAFAQATSGINPVSRDTILEDFVCKGCGQGVEAGFLNVIIRRGLVTEPGPGSPSIAFNIGSHSYGVFNTVLENCAAVGYESSVQCGNGIGRLSNVHIRNNKFDGGCTFYGGKTENNVVTEWQRADTYGSSFTGNELFCSPTGHGQFTYNGGVNDNNGLFGREPILIQGNHFRYTHIDAQSTPTVGFAGKITAVCQVIGNFFYGLPVGPSRGDIASFTNNDNPAVPGMPTLIEGSNMFLDQHGQRRQKIVLIEGAA